MIDMSIRRTDRRRPAAPVSRVRSPLHRRLVASSFALSMLLVTLVIDSFAAGAHAMKIREITSPGGVRAWLVEERSVPLLALRFAFDGGNAQDPAGKEGLAHFLSGMLDEGAGDLDSVAFQERREELAVRLSFDDGREYFYGSFETLSANRDDAVELLRLAVNAPRFDADAIDRVRKQLQANLAFAARNPNQVASRAWSETAFPAHPYGRPATGTGETLKAITAADLESYRRRIFARDTLKVVLVGDIDEAAAGRLLDRVFEALPKEASLVPVAGTSPIAGPKLRIIEMDVPQSVAQFGLPGIDKTDPDFFPAFVLNQLLGGGGFASRLMEEVREKRGLAYSTYSYLHNYRRAAVLAGGVATRNEDIAKSLEVIRSVLHDLATNGPTPEELENAKSYLTGSFALRFDTNAKIANQLLGFQIEEYGIDYVDRRNGLIEAVTHADAIRVAARLLRPEAMVVTVVGKPVGLQATAKE